MRYLTHSKLLSIDYVSQLKICPRQSSKASRAENGFYLYFRREIVLVPLDGTVIVKLAELAALAPDAIKVIISVASTATMVFFIVFLLISNVQSALRI